MVTQDEYEQSVYEAQQAETHKSLTQTQQAEAQAQYYYEEKEKTLAEAQLEVDTILSEIYHLLKQDVYKETNNKSFEWEALKDQKERVLSDWGVDRIIQLVKFYINKNTLLSNFSEEQIKQRMLKFMLSLNGLMLMKYEFLFRELTFEECKEVLQLRIENKKKMRMYALEIIGKQGDEKQIKQEIISEMEKRVDFEIQKIKQEKRKQNLREYEMLLTQLEAIIEATHNRAWRGEERGSIRRHTSIHELIGGSPSLPQKQGGFNWRRN